MSEGWRCFHCDQVFTDRGAARDHFGKETTDEPNCVISERKWRDAFREERRVAVRLREGLECLLPGLELDLRYANDDDDKDALRSRVRTVREALLAVTPDEPSGG